MAKCNFSIEFTGNAEHLIARAGNAITNAGGQFSGDNSAGAFSLSTIIGSISGTYTIVQSKFQIEITDKPVFVSCKMIEGELRKYL